MNLPLVYVDKIKQRSTKSFMIGAIARLPKYIFAAIKCNYARLKGATIGQGTVISWKIAKSANSNLVVGDDCHIDAEYMDLRSRIVIGNHVIINKGVQIIRLSHYINDDTVFTTRYYPPLEIHDYSWLATGCKVLPQVNDIATGTVCGAFSVISRNTDSMGVYSGNPATRIKNHNTVFQDTLICSFSGCDFPYYIKARLRK